MLDCSTRQDGKFANASALRAPHHLHFHSRPRHLDVCAVFGVGSHNQEKVNTIPKPQCSTTS